MEQIPRKAVRQTLGERSSVGGSSGRDVRALGSGFDLRGGVSRQPLGEAPDRRLMSGFVREVVKFAGIAPMIVKFPCSVLVDDQAPVSGADRMIAKVGRRDCRSFAG